MKRITIAIDGYSSCGKSTMAKALAKRIGYVYIDSGAMYRAVTLYALKHGMIYDGKVDEDKLKADIDGISISFKINDDGKQVTCLNGKDVENRIRRMDVSGNVSAIAAIPFVREAITSQLQAMGRDKGIVMDGRDIGTTVFPDAELKIFVMASAEIRAERRFKELREKGDMDTTYESVLENVRKRDEIDINREVSPLKKADDAIVLDNGEMTIEQQDEWLIKRFEEVIGENAVS